MSRTYDLCLRLLPWGPLTRDAGALHLAEIQAWSEEIDWLDDQAADSVEACFPDSAELLAHWEAIYDLHPSPTDPTAIRLARLLEAVRRIPLMTPAYIELQLERLDGVDVTIIEHMAFHCDDIGSLVDRDAVERQWTFYAAFARTAAVLAGMDPNLIREQALVDRLKPGHSQGVACFDAFRTDDAYSVTDRDLLEV